MYIIIASVIISMVYVFFYNYKTKRMYCKIDRILDEILSERPISQSDILEGKISALANKAMRVQEKLQYEINQANKEKEQIKELISDMSHQLKTPLAAIMMFQELLEERELPEEERSELQKRLHNQTERLEWILNSLFKMINLEQGAIEFEIENNYIKETIIEAVSSVYQKAEKKKVQICMREFYDYKILHNRKWTVEVLVNILENAIKYTPSGGKIEIAVISLQMYSRIEVRDNGIGIRQEEKIKIFKRFYRSCEVQNIEGSGIGLYLSKLILEKEKGYLTVKSKYGKGSCFFIYLQNCKN